MATFTNVATLSYNGTVVNSKIYRRKPKRKFKRNNRRDTADSRRNEAFPCKLLQAGRHSDLYREYCEHGKHSIYKSYVNR